MDPRGMSSNYHHPQELTTTTRKLASQEMSSSSRSKSKRVPPPPQAAEQREPNNYDLPISLSRSTSSLSASITTESNYQQSDPNNNNNHNHNPTDSNIMRGAEVLRKRLQQQQQSVIDKEAARIRKQNPPEYPLPQRARHYRNSSYFSDTEEDDDDGNDPWGDDDKAASHFSFPEEGDAQNWAKLSYDEAEEDDDNFALGAFPKLAINNSYRSNNNNSYRSNTRSSIARGQKTAARPDTYIASPPKRSTTTANDKVHDTFSSIHQYEQAQVIQELDFNTQDHSFPAFASAKEAEASSYLPNGLWSPERNGTNSSVSSPAKRSTASPSSSSSYAMRHSPSHLSQSYSMGSNQNSTFTAESDALDMLVAQISPSQQQQEQAHEQAQPKQQQQQEHHFTSKEQEKAVVLQDTSQDEEQKIHRLQVSIPTPVVLDMESPCKYIVSPSSKLYTVLLKDPAFQHAQRAGTLWQSVVGQHVKFPSKWWNGARSPPMGIAERRLWQYHGRHRVGGDATLNKLVYNRGSAGRVLLHIVVRDDASLEPVLDIAIGCFHPNARGIRNSTAAKPSLEDCRDIWLATRQRRQEELGIESLLREHDRDGRHPKKVTVGESPLGTKHAVNNGNMRMVFGEKPPLHTLFCFESSLYDLLSAQSNGKPDKPPSLVLLQRFLKVR